MIKRILSLLSLIVFYSISSYAASITLPYENNMDTYSTYSAMVQEESDSTFTHTTTGCWSGGCGKWVPGTVDLANAVGLWYIQDFTPVSRLNIRFLVKIGTTLASTNADCGEGTGVKFVFWNASGTDSRPILHLLLNSSHFFPCADDDVHSICCSTGDCTGLHGTEALKFGDGVGTGDYAGQWVSLEFEATVGGYIRLYVSTQDGVYNNTLYISNNVSDATGLWNYISSAAGGYWNGCNPGRDANTYFMIDELKIVSTGNIGPPAGFVGGGDTTAPTVTNVTSDKTNGTYTVGEVIDIDVTFDEAVTSTGNVTVTLETGTTDRTCTFTVSGATTGTCNYTVQAGDTSADLTVATNGISGTVVDAADNAMVTPTNPTTNLAANKAIVIDTTAPTVSSVSIAANGTTITVNFDATVVTTGYDNGDFDLDCSIEGSGVSLNSISGSGSSRTFTVSSTIVSGDTCNIDYTGGANEIEDSAGNDLAAFSNTSVTNNSSVPSAPTGITIIYD